MKTTTKYIIAYLTSYLIVCMISLFFVRCEFDIVYDDRYNNECIDADAIASNLKVLRYYFIDIPIVVTILLILYYILARSVNKPERSSDNCIIIANGDTIQKEGFFGAMRNMSYYECWTKISANPDKAFGYMLHYPEKFFIATKPKDKPNWEDSNFCETIIVNGRMYYIYLHTKSFLIDLDKCVEAIKK